ncbi:MAG: serine hydrolase domain-containing protein [Pseudomonadota bacterium]
MRVVLVSLGALCLSACSVVQSQNPTRFEKADFAGRSLDDALGMIAEATVEDGAPGAIVAVMRDYDVSVVSAGLAQKRTDRPMPLSHPLRIASISKVYTATIAVMLARDGVLDLDAPIKNYLPSDVIRDLPNGDVVTTRHLLTHTGGMPDIYDLRSVLFQDWSEEITLERMLPVAKRQGATGTPGQDFDYSDMGYIIAGAVIEAASARPLEDLVADRVFRPTQATASFVNVKFPVTPSIHGYGLRHRPDADAWDRWEHSGPAAGVMASAEDVTKVIAALVFEDGALADIGQAMLEAPVEVSPRFSQGLGLHKLVSGSGYSLIGHSGSINGYVSFAYARPDRNTVLFGHLNRDCEELRDSMRRAVLLAEEFAGSE